MATPEILSSSSVINEVKKPLSLTKLRLAGSLLMLTALGLPIAGSGCGDNREFYDGTVTEKLFYPDQYVRDCDLIMVKPLMFDCDWDFYSQRFAVRLRHCFKPEERDCKTREVTVTEDTFNGLEIGQFVAFEPPKQ